MTEQDRAIMVKNHARWLAFNAGVPWDKQDVIDCDEFWEQQPYNTRLYFGPGIADYLHRSVLRTAIEILDREESK